MVSSESPAGPHPQGNTQTRLWWAQTRHLDAPQDSTDLGSLRPQNPHRFQGEGREAGSQTTSALPPPSHETSQPTAAWVPVSAPTALEKVPKAEKNSSPARSNQGRPASSLGKL